MIKINTNDVDYKSITLVFNLDERRLINFKPYLFSNVVLYCLMEYLCKSLRKTGDFETSKNSKTFEASKFISDGSQDPQHTVVGLFLCLTVSCFLYKAKSRNATIPYSCHNSSYKPITWTLTTGECSVPAFCVLPSQAYAFGQKPSKNMCSTINCPDIHPGSQAQAAPLQSDKVMSLISDFFNSSIEVHNLRRDVRQWFLSNVVGWDENFGSTLPEQIQHYQLLDELLHDISVALIQNAESK